MQRCAPVVLALSLACAPLQAPLEESRDAAVYGEFQTAKTLQREDPDAAAEAFRSFLLRWPDHALSDDAAVALARLDRRAGRLDEAEVQLQFVLREHPRGARAEEARLLLARLRLDRGDVEGARRSAGGIRVSRLPAGARAEAHRLQADIARAEGDRVTELRWLSWVRADTADGDALALVDVEIDELIGRLGPRELESAADQLGKRTPAGRVRLRLAEHHLVRGEAVEARRQLDLAGRLPMSTLEVARLREMDARVEAFETGGLDPLAGSSRFGLPDLEPPSTAGARGTLGVVLPLSGGFAPYGEESLQGILLAAGLYDGSGSGAGGVRLLVRDSGGTAAGAARAVAALAEHDEVLGVIGPLLGDESEAAAAAAQEAKLPMVSLAARERVARGRSHVLRVGLTPRSEAQLLVDFAVTRAEARRFAILFPRDPFGTALKDLFWDAVEARGGEVVGLASYDPDANDFKQAIQALIGYRLLGEGEKASIRERERLLRQAKRATRDDAKALRAKAAKIEGPGGQVLPPIVDFDALFVPDAAANVTLIAPQLAFHDVRGVQLLGPSGWYGPDLVRIGGVHVEGAVFTEAFYPDSEIPFVRSFAQRYAETYGARAGSLAAQAYDAANLVLVQLAHGKNTRGAVRKGLLDVRGYPGVSGLVNVLADGNAAKRPYLLRVRGGEVEPAD